jgi:hypothetical protein
MIANGSPVIVGVESASAYPTVPDSYELRQNYPNPFNPETAISFQIPAYAGTAVSIVRLRVFDMLGRLVATLVDERLPAGMYKTVWNASELPSGVYLLHMTAAPSTSSGNMGQAGSGRGFEATRKIVLIR